MAVVESSSAQIAGSGQQIEAAVKPEVETVDVLVYSDDRATRRIIIDSIGRRAGKGLPLLRWTEAATHAGALERISETNFAALVLDSEAAKVGGMALSRELKTTLFDCPPILITVARPQDRWLAAWSEADAVVAEPLDPVELQEALAGLLRAQGGEATAGTEDAL